MMKLEELASHDVLEFCYSIRHPKHWNNDSVFIDYDAFICLSSYLERVISDYPYFDAQEVTMEQWEKIERLALEEGKRVEKQRSGGKQNFLDSWGIKIIQSVEQDQIPFINAGLKSKKHLAGHLSV